MTTAFLYTVPVGVLAFVLSFLLRDVRLRTSLGGQESEPAEMPDAAVAAGVGAGVDGVRASTAEPVTDGRAGVDGVRVSTAGREAPSAPRERAGPGRPVEPVRPAVRLEPPGL